LLAIISKDEVLLVSVGEFDYLISNQVADDTLVVDKHKAVIADPGTTINSLVEFFYEGESVLNTILFILTSTL
jgi:predicted nucleic acid-binding protein